MKRSDFSPNNPVRAKKDVNSMTNDEYYAHISSKITWEMQNCSSLLRENHDKARRMTSELDNLNGEKERYNNNYAAHEEMLGRVLKQINPARNAAEEIKATAYSRNSAKIKADIDRKDESYRKRNTEIKHEEAEIKKKMKFWERESKNISVPPPKRSFWGTLFAALIFFAQGYAGVYFFACFLVACKLDDCTLAVIVSYLIAGCEEIGCKIIPTQIIPLNTILFYVILIVIGTHIYCRNREDVPERIE